MLLSVCQTSISDGHCTVDTRCKNRAVLTRSAEIPTGLSCNQHLQSQAEASTEAVADCERALAAPCNAKLAGSSKTVQIAVYSYSC